VVLRYGLLYGPGTWYSAGGSVEARLRAGELAAGEAVTSFLHVHDAAWAAVQALTWKAGIYNVVDDEPAQARAWAPVLASVLGAPAPLPSPGRAGWERGASNRLARSIGWRSAFPTWRTGFATLAPGDRARP
jgi:nucleoside-diphosphate-sugar epimerase